MTDDRSAVAPPTTTNTEAIAPCRTTQKTRLAPEGARRPPVVSTPTASVTTARAANGTESISARKERIDSAIGFPLIKRRIP